MPGDHLKLKELTMRGLKSVDSLGQSMTFGFVKHVVFPTILREN